jgi:hypothetical protein
MGLAIDTVLLDVHNAATTALGLTAATAAVGDSLGIRSFGDSAYCRLENVFLQGASAPRRVRILSPRLHDNVTGVSYQAAESPTEFLLAAEYSQVMYSSDVLVVQMDAAASSDTVAALSMYYSDLPGVNANLRTWAQVEPNIIDIKPVEVDVTTNATIGQWADTVITTTENQLKANYNYAVLGFETSATLLCMGVKGPSTGNLRICIPGASPTLRLTDYFIFQSQSSGIPYIPVINANDRAATYVSTAANTSAATANVYMILARLAN